LTSTLFKHSRRVMQKAQHLSTWSLKLVRSPHFWVVAVMFAIGANLHYHQLPFFWETEDAFSFFGFTRHAAIRVFLLVPITYAGFFFGTRGGIVSLVVALSIMLPRTIFISPSPADALFESISVIAIGAVVNFLFQMYRKEKERSQQALSEVEAAHHELQESQRSYEHLFKSAYDAIWVHDLEGNIQVANEAAAELSGYPVEELLGMNVRSFLDNESLNLAREVGDKLTRHQPVGMPYEQRLVRKNGSEAMCMVNTNLIASNGEAKGFQNIARDVTEEKRMQDNLRYYLQQITKAQEEERARIARELHDDTSQELVVLSRRLGNFISTAGRLSTQDITRLEELKQQIDKLFEEVHRFSQDLRPSVLDDLGLLPALESLSSDSTQHFGLATAMGAIGSVRRLPPETELVLFRIAQEALRNVCKHAEASKAWITLEFSDDRVVLSVNDNGRGFELPRMIGELATVGKLGLAGMQERAQLIRGKLVIQSELGKGTTVTAEVPI